MSPDAVSAMLARVRLRRRVRSIASSIAISGAIFAVIFLLIASSTASVIAAAAAALVVVASSWRVDDTELAQEIESIQPADNLIVTAAQLEHQHRPVSREIRDEIVRQAAQRAQNINPSAVISLSQPLLVATAVLIGCAILTNRGAASPLNAVADELLAAASVSENDLSVRVTPPAYTIAAGETHTNPLQITVIAGSQIRIESRSRVVREWVATVSESLEVRAHEDSAPRFLSVVVVPDAPPSVRITEPGRDTAYAAANVAVRLGVEARDDLGLRSLSLRYTKASGGGENVTFTEGEVSLRIERADDRQWRARGEWRLDNLGLADGDVLVYRAIARDTNPSGTAIESDAFLIEIGRTAEIASAGFALPTEERKYAISQQMVIYKTEQLIANRARHPSDWLEQTRMVGMEQRMVRAEVVFLSGGEVQDEVEEAAHSHELAEGRLENQGRAEMVRALNFMSRAEAQLNDGNAVEALVFERQALASLERALDRRRYFLRTLPDRSRIDASRRLTGDRREARSWIRDRTRADADAGNTVRVVMRDLAAAATGALVIDATLAARVAAIDPQSAELQQAAVGVAAAASAEERRAAVLAAMDAVTAHALTVLPGAAPVYLKRDPLAGRLADEMSARPKR